MTQPQARILVADDDPTNLTLLSQPLAKAGYDVVTAGNGVEAVRAVEEHAPDAILLDMMMPEMDGLEVSSLLRSKEATASIPILFVTAQTDSDKIIDAFEHGGVDYITKPFRVDEILARVSVHVRLRVAERELAKRNAQLEELAQKLEQINEQLARQAREDPLTKLLNRGAWGESAKLEHARTLRHDQAYGVVLLDIDKFKALNDKQGHQAGDECLRRIADCLSSACRSIDLIGRYGGEEFVILAPGSSDEGLRTLAERVRSVVYDLALPHPSSDVADRVTVSVGFASSRPDQTLEEVIHAADQAMYRAKTAGRNRICDATDPSTPQASRPAAGPPGPPSLADDRPGVVLVVDDDLTTRTLCRRLLATRGYRVHEAQDGAEALAAVSRLWPDVILMDVAMPRMDGRECVRRLKASKLTQDIPVVMISAHTDAEEMRAGLAAGADEYLAKPVSTRELEVRVRTMTRLYRRHRRSLLAEKAEAEAGVLREELAERRRIESELRKAKDELDDAVQERTRELEHQKQQLEHTIEQLHQAHTQLFQAQKLESIGQLAAGIAHEINTPTQYVGDNVRFLRDGVQDMIAIVDGCATMLDPDAGPRDWKERTSEMKSLLEQLDFEFLRAETPKAIEQSLEGVERVAKIVRSMKEFSHPGGDEKQMVNLNKAIESTVTVSRNEWKYVADMVTDLDASLPLVPCMLGEFNQVILNMIVNAAHAIEDVTGHDSSGKGTITISTRGQGDWVEIRVSDTGTGIPEHIRPKIFDPFFTTKEVGKGTGQGLAIAHATVVNLHGGQISVESEVGRGTTFVVRLPLGEAPGEATETECHEEAYSLRG